MKNYLISLCALATCATAMASGGTVVANGGFRDPKEGVATFAANINADELSKAFFVFASEGSHHGPDYPDADLVRAGVGEGGVDDLDDLGAAERLHDEGAHVGDGRTEGENA